jgi:perosamine synthetase
LEFFKQRDAFYLESLMHHEKISFPDNNNCNTEEIRQWTDILSSNRDEIKARLLDNNIQSRAFWYPLHQQEPYYQADSKFPNAVSVSKQGLWLPSSFSLTKEQAQFVCEVIQNIQ